MLILREQKYCMYLQIYAQIPERRPKLTWIFAVLPFRLMEPYSKYSICFSVTHA